MNEEITIGAIVEICGIEHVQGEIHRCPKCEHRSMKIVAAKHVWFCHFCDKGGGPVRLAAIAWKVDIQTAIKKICDELGLTPEARTSVERLLERLDKLEAGVSPEDPREAILTIVHSYWHAAEKECATVRKNFTGPGKLYPPGHLDPDPFFQAVEDAVNDGVIADAAMALKWSKSALDGIRAAFAKLGIKVERAKPPRFRSKVEVAAIKGYLDTRREFVEKCLAKRPDLSLEQILTAQSKYNEIKGGVPK